MTVKEFIQLAKTNNIEPIQITTFKEKSLDLEVLNNSLKKFNTMARIDYTIVAHYNEKDVTVYSNYLDKDIIDEIMLKANNIETDYKEVYIKENKTKKDKPKEISFDVNKEKEEILKIHKSIEKEANLKDLESYYFIVNREKTINNSYGLDISTNKNIYAFSSEVIMEKGDIISDIYNTTYSIKNDINIEKDIMRTLQEAKDNLTKEEIESKKYNVVLSNVFTSRLLSAFIQFLSKEKVRKQNSFLENKLDKKIFGDNITIIEDPNNKNYPGYQSFDDEGVDTYKKTIIDNGVLKTYLYNNKEALLDNEKSTGNGYGGISARNIYIESGNKSEEELINAVKDGLYIKGFQSTGGTLINSSTGDISVQVRGQIIKDGKKTNSFETSILTTSIYELFSNVVELGNNLEFRTTAAGAPSLYVKDMSISSK